jgi:hypothetical protein
MTHREVVAARRIAEIEVVDRQRLGEGHRLVRRRQRDHRRRVVEHIVPPDLIRTIRQPVRMGGVGGLQQDHRRRRGARCQHHDVAGPALLALLRLADDLGDGLARGVGLQPHHLAAGQQCDIGQAHDRLDGQGPRIAFGAQQAGIAAAGLAFDAGRGDRMRLIQLDPQRQGEGLPPLHLPVPLQRRDARVVMDGRIRIRRLVSRLGRIVAATAVHLPQGLGLVVIRGQGLKRDRPGGGDAARVLDLGEVPRPHPHQGRAVEGGVAPDPVVGVRNERMAVLVVPVVPGAVAALDEDRLGAPVLRFARQMLATLEDQDGLAGRGQSLGQGRAPCARTDDDDVEAGGHALCVLGRLSPRPDDIWPSPSSGPSGRDPAAGRASGRRRGRYTSPARQ